MTSRKSRQTAVEYRNLKARRRIGHQSDKARLKFHKLGPQSYKSLTEHTQSQGTFNLPQQGIDHPNPTVGGFPSLGQSNTTTGYRQMVQQTSSSWYSPHWHNHSFPQLAVVTGFTSAKLAFGSSFLSSFLTQLAQTEALPSWWLHRLALQSHAKLVNIQVPRQGWSFTGAIQHHNWLSSNGSTNVEQLVTLVQQRTQTEALPLYPSWWLQYLLFSQTLQCTMFPRKDSWIPIGTATNLFRKLLDPWR